MPANDSTPDDCKILYDSGNGMSIREIAELVGCHVDTVRNRLRREGVLAQPAPRPKSPVRPEVCADLYKKGMSVRAISKEVGISYCAVYNRLQEAGVTMRPPGPARPRTARKVAEPPNGRQ